MNEFAAFHHAIVAAPDDDIPRLIFADWLEEHGEGPRAEFIRAQCELAHTPEFEPFFVDCREHRPEWFRGPDPSTVPNETLKRYGVSWDRTMPNRRGFGWSIATETLPGLELVMPELLTWEPIGALHLPTARLDEWRDFARLPWLRGIRELHFEGLSTPIEPWRVLAQSPNVSGVRHISTIRGDSPAIAEIVGDLFASPLGQQLESFALRNGVGIPFNLMQVLTRHDDPMHLKQLTLHNGNIDAACLGQLLQSRIVERLVVLRLPHNPILLVHDLVRRAERMPVQVLDLRDCRLDASEIALLGTGRFQQLRKLIVAGNRLAECWQELLWESPGFRQLRSLDLSTTGLEIPAIPQLVAAPFWPNLVELHLDRNPLTDEAAKLLMEAPRPQELQLLRLSARGFSAKLQRALGKHFGAALHWRD